MWQHYIQVHKVDSDCIISLFLTVRLHARRPPALMGPLFRVQVLGELKKSIWYHCLTIFTPTNKKCNPTSFWPRSDFETQSRNVKWSHTLFTVSVKNRSHSCVTHSSDSCFSSPWAKMYTINCILWTPPVLYRSGVDSSECTKMYRSGSWNCSDEPTVSSFLWRPFRKHFCLFALCCCL